ncbi:aminomethyl-transferring glycine dehydrogenase subunit GcvPA [Candidatus Fermentibacteria bacterium]|nr:aminomethyl-transferring glycine dehydrogenase subunit GcvPA [Candidatus Fermentibacteria bacterium]
MLSRIGVDRFDDLLRPIPETARFSGLLDLPPSLAEGALARHVKELSERNVPVLSFMGAGSYEHFRPAVVDYVCGRPEFRTAYTPYQAEVSQGTLQTIYEFQTAIVELTGMEVANASMYEGGSAVAEAMLMAVSATGRSSILISEGVHPLVRRVVHTYARPNGIAVIPVPLHQGTTPDTAVRERAEGAAGLIYQEPNFFGCIENQQRLIEASHAAGGLAIASVDPLSLSVLEPPGALGADIAAGEGQALAAPVSFGGPGVGFLACTQRLIRKLPGRLVGATVDGQGRRGFVLTLQAREQHIRRQKATSNICTNQALVALGFLVTVSALGPHGLANMASQATQKAHYYQHALQKRGFPLAFDAPFLWEFTVRTGIPAATYVEGLLSRGVLPGLDLGTVSPDLAERLLVYVSEMRTREELDRTAELMGEVSHG